MEYFLVDKFNGNINVINDKHGNPLLFETCVEAFLALDEYCQEGVVIPLYSNVMSVLQDCYNFISKNNNNFESKMLIHDLEKVLDNS